MSAGLDVVVIADHNTFEAVVRVRECAEDKGLVAFPGICGERTRCDPIPKNTPAFKDPMPTLYPMSVDVPPMSNWNKSISIICEPLSRGITIRSNSLKNWRS